jgi:hypothetical protein
MYVPAAALILLGGAMGLSQRLTGAADQAAILLQSREDYAARVLDLLTPYPPTIHDFAATPHDLLRGLSTTIMGALLAALALGSVRARRLFGWWRPIGSAARGLHRFQTRFLPGYLAWLAAGTAVFCLAAVVLLR